MLTTKGSDVYDKNVNTRLLKVGFNLKKMEINSNEVARLAGVSRSTVSRVINNYSNVPLKTREKVLKAIKELNYFPNVSAQMLAGKKSRTIGLFMVSSGEIAVDVLTNMMIVSVIESASDLNYYVLTYIIRDASDEGTINNVREMFYQRRIDGGIFIGTKHDEAFVDDLVKQGFIVGVFDQEHPAERVPNRIVANFNNESGMKQAIAYLLGLGHRDIGIINGDRQRLSGIEKYEGFLSAMRQQGLPVHEQWVLNGDFSEQAGYEAMQHYLQRSGADAARPTAWVAANDSVAFGAIRALREAGLLVPEHVSVIGFDDHVLSEKHNPPLTTVRVDFKQLFKDLMQMVIAQIEEQSDAVKEVAYDCTLIIRQSCRRLD